jgi:hypothetical protein
MALKIIKATDPIDVQQLVVTIYSAPGIGKTSLGFTANAPLLIDFDEGAYRSGNRGDSVSARSWRDAADISADDLKDYSTVVVDTAGRALDKLAADIIARDPKMGRGGALTLQGFGRLKAEFTAWLKMLRSFGADVVLLAHMDEQKNGDEVIERIDAQGASKNEIYKVSDAMGRLAIRAGKRVLLFSPTDTAFGKNPANLDTIAVPSFDAESRFLGETIDGMKASLNTLSSDQQEVARLLSEWTKVVASAKTAGSMNGLLSQIEDLDERVRDTAKKLLWNHAKAHEIKFDAKRHVFVEAA